MMVGGALAAALVLATGAAVAHAPALTDRATVRATDIGTDTRTDSATDDSTDDAGVDTSGEWNFRVLLDGKPIGRHRFSVSTADGQSNVVSDARFDVTVLGFTVYRYRHHAIEHWRDGCLQSIQASTDEGGKHSSVQGDRQGDPFVVASSAGRETLRGCVMSFAYWNPALRARTRLLNPQTGRYDSVHIARLEAGSIDVRGRAAMAQHWRLSGAESPIDLWISAQGEWIGLDSTVNGGRKLSYRLD